MIDFYDVIATSKGIPAADEFAALWGRKISGGYVISTYTGTLPATLQTVAGYLASYKIWGNTGGIGVETENILQNVLERTEVKGVTFTINADKSITISGSLTDGGDTYITIGTVAFESGETYTIDGVSGYSPSTLQLFTQSSSAFAMGNRLQSYNGYTTRTAAASETCDIRLYVYTGITYDNVTVYPQVVKGSAALPYEPYGYKLPILSNETVTDIYIGDTALGKDEYADSEKVKIYKRTENLFDEAYPNIRNDSPVYRSLFVGDGEFTLSTSTGKRGAIANLFLLAGIVTSGASTGTNGVWEEHSRTITSLDGYITIAYRHYEDEKSDPRFNATMLNLGSIALPYEPYLSPTDPPVPLPQIPTFAGETTISYGGAGVQPEKVELKYRR